MDLRYTKRKSSIFEQSEDSLQSQVESYLAFFPFLRVVHIPKASYRAVKKADTSWTQKKAIAKNKGVPDLMIFRENVNSILDNHALLLELKSKTGKPSPEQIEWHKGTNAQIENDFYEIKAKIDEWINETNPR